MKIHTTKLLATDTQGARIRVKVNGGVEATYPFPYESNEPHLYCVQMLLGKQTELTLLAESTRGYVFEPVLGTFSLDFYL